VLIAKVSWADVGKESAIAAFLSRTSHASPNDELLVAKVDFNQDGNAEFLLCYSVTDYFKHVGHTWTVLEFKDGNWTEPKTLNKDGVIENSSEVVFDEGSVSFVHLDKYNHSGILSHPNQQSRFTYLQDDTLKTMRFGKASDIGLSEEQLKRLVESN